MDENADDSQVISEPPPESWRRPPGWPRTTWMKTIQGDLSCVDLELHEARELAQNSPLWRLMSLYSAMHSQWCMLMFRVHILLLIKRSGTFSGLSRTSKTFFQRHSLLHVYYWTYCSSTANTLDQVHCTQRCNTHTHYIWNTKYFTIYCHFLSVSKSPN